MLLMQTNFVSEEPVDTRNNRGQIPSLSSCDVSEPSCVFRQLSSTPASLWVYHSSLPTQAGAVFSNERIAF